MNTATKNLEDDHVHILRLLDVMEHITRNEATDVKHFETIVEIIRNFADGIHHAKEENLFFPYFAARGFPSNQGPVAVMLQEHVQGRNYVKAISENIESFKNGNDSALKEIYINMNGYAGLLRNHIAKENNILFRMADSVLSEADQNQLLYRFGEAEKDNSLLAGPDHYIKLIEALESSYGVSH